MPRSSRPAINQLIRWIVEINWGGQAAPVFDMWDQEARDQLQAARDKSNYDAGARFTNAYWERAYGYQTGDLAEPAEVAPPMAPVSEPAGSALPAVAVDAEKQAETAKAEAEAEADPNEEAEFCGPEGQVRMPPTSWPRRWPTRAMRRLPAGSMTSPPCLTRWRASNSSASCCWRVTARLPAEQLVTVMATALAAIELRGRADVLAGQ